MHFHHVHFYVDHARKWRKWFEQRLGFVNMASSTSDHTQTEILHNGPISILLSAPLNQDSPIAHYLHHHASGVADVAFQVDSLHSTLESALKAGATLLHPPTSCYLFGKPVTLAQIQGWENLRHTLVEHRSTADRPAWSASDPAATPLEGTSLPYPDLFTAIDHVVLNVETGDLGQAVSWYEQVLGFQQRQSFAIQTERSGLSSQVLVHPAGTVQLPINEPASDRSQIQEFLTWNRGAGIQHIALRTHHLVDVVAYLRRQQLDFLPIPATYYDHLRRRAGERLTEQELRAIAAQGILADWQDPSSESRLLQIFTQPVFGEPTFFFELIERQTLQIANQTQVAQGFGEGNFQALFEAMERQQIQRGTL